MCQLAVILVGALAVAAGLWLQPAHLGRRQVSYETASTAASQDMLENLGAALDTKLNIIARWLFPPPGARFAIGAPDKHDKGAVPVIRLKWCKHICVKTKFPTVVDPKCAVCLTFSSLPTWAHGTPSRWGKPNPPLARLPVYESGFTSLAAIPMLYPRRWATADLRQVCFGGRGSMGWGG
jgi:hypothetical protein